MRIAQVLILITLFLSCVKKDEVVVKKEIDLQHRYSSAEITSLTDAYVHQDFKDIYIDKENRWSIFSHPDLNVTSSIRYASLEINTDFELSFYIGIDEKAWNKESQEHTTDGVEFVVRDNHNNELYKRKLDPVTNESDRGWIKEDLTIEVDENQIINELIFETKPGETTTSDWAYWAEPKIKLPGSIENHTNHSKTNIILITLDTLRKDYLSCYGNNWIDTPNMDGLADKGVLFENAYSSSSTTSPSHVSIFTSLNPYVHGVISNTYHLGEKIPTLTQILKEDGYQTGASVSIMHLNKSISGLGNYFDYYNQPKKITASSNWEVMNSAYSTVSAGIEFMDDHHNDPFFLWLHLYDAHMPYLPPAEYDRRFYVDDPYSTKFVSMKNVTYMRGFPFQNESWMHGITDLNYFKRQYGAEITYVDDQIGRVLDALDRLHLDDNTMIVLTADHGESLGENGIYFNHWNLFEPEIAVPMLVYHPGHKPKKKRIDKRVSIIDVAPTIVDVLDREENVIAETMFDGKSLVPLWEDKPFERRNILSNSLNYIQNACIGDRYKVNWIIRDASYNIHINLPKDRVLVYDLIEDPDESDPVAGFMWSMEEGEPVHMRKDMKDHERMLAYRNNAKLKVVPSIAELKEMILMEKPGHFVHESLINDDEFYNEVQNCLQRMWDELHLDLKKRLQSVLDLSGLSQLEIESMNIDDPEFLDQLNSLGYGGGH